LRIGQLDRQQVSSCTNRRFEREKVILTLQVHPQQGETVQVRRMRQRLLPESHSGGAQDPAHGGVTAQVSGLCQKFQSEEQPEDSSSHAHGHQTVSLRLLRQGVSQELRPEETFVDSQSGGAVVATSVIGNTRFRFEQHRSSRDVLVPLRCTDIRTIYRVLFIYLDRHLVRSTLPPLPPPAPRPRRRSDIAA